MAEKLTDWKSNERLAALLVGDSGSGKTTLASTAPGKVYFFLFDHEGLESILDCPNAENIEYDMYYPKPHLKPVANVAMAKLQGGDPKESWTKAQSKLRELSAKCPYDTVVMDSVTSMQDSSWTFVRASHGMAAGDIPKLGGSGTMELYQSLGEQSLMFFYGFMSLPCNRIVIAHETTKEDTRTGRQIPMLRGTGKMFSEKLDDGRQFRHVWRTKVLQKEEGLHYAVETRGGNGFPTKTSWKWLEDIEQPNIQDMLNKKPQVSL